MADTAIDTPRLSIPVDSEHGALRFSIVLIFFVGWIISFAILNSVLMSEGLNLVAILLSLIAAGLVARGVEVVLQTRWPSGRAVEVDRKGVRIVRRGVTQYEIDAQEPVSVLLWKFEIKRRSRVPKGWYVLACALEQNDDFLPVYAFASPKDVEELTKTIQFTELASEKEMKKKDARYDSLRFAGEQRRLRLAENFRWERGAEMTLANFEEFLGQLNGYFSQWMP